MTSRKRWLASVIAVFATIAIANARMMQLSDTFTNWRDHPAIAYGMKPTADRVAELDRKLQDGRVQLKFDGSAGYLRAVLDALQVPVESQMAVFVPDSVQARRISAGNPRTLFFNDDVVVGWVRGGFIELAAEDPRQGTIFYSLDQTFLGAPRITRRNDCLTCHYSYSTVGVPGMLVRSVGQYAVDHRLPFDQRWGGWYVTGAHGSMRHLGNADPAQLFGPTRPTNTFNWPSFDGKFDWRGYLTPTSDIVALLVFEHQMHVMNLLTRIGWEARVAASEGGHAAAFIPLDDAAKELVDYLLFVDEAPLTDAVHSSSGFAEIFASRGPYDHQGRSLRQLDLHHRLLRYPCSYMIYAAVFTELPKSAKDAIYRRMWRILSGAEHDAKYARLSVVDRQAIVEILRDTKKDLPEYFRPILR